MEVKYLLVISDSLRGGGGGKRNLTQVLSRTVRGSYLAPQLLVAARFACLLSSSRCFCGLPLVLGVQHGCLMLLSDLLGSGPAFKAAKHCHSRANFSC